MRISIIFTGGTIGSLTKNEWVGVDESSRYLLLDRIDKEGITFETVAPYTILSEHLSSRELNLLQDCVAKELQKQPDGIIITHGTDTLQYSAAAIEYAFADTPVPIVFVSADYPLDNPKTNGFINFEAAVRYIQAGAPKGVFVSYKNVLDSAVKLHVASRLLQHSEGTADLYSLNDSVVAEYRDGKLEAYPVPFVSHRPLGMVSYTEDTQILSVESAPGNAYRYSLEGIKAVILKPYHSATLDTANQSLAAFCRRANEADIPVFVCGAREGCGYESAKAFEELHIRIAPYSTYVSLYMKLWAAISLEKDIPSFVNERIANE